MLLGAPKLGYHWSCLNPFALLSGQRSRFILKVTFLAESSTSVFSFSGLSSQEWKDNNSDICLENGANLVVLLSVWRNQPNQKILSFLKNFYINRSIQLDLIVWKVQYNFKFNHWFDKTLWFPKCTTKQVGPILLIM